jgi:DNA-binding response OmpR family regulator
VVAGKLLIALKDKSLLRLYCDFLSRMGYEVAEAMDGLRCMNILQNFAPDLVVVDPALPWGGGEGVVAWMREECNLPDVPILALNTRSSQAPIFFVTIPVDMYLQTPPAPEQLAKAVRWLLGQNSYQDMLDEASRCAIHFQDFAPRATRERGQRVAVKAKDEEPIQITG